LLIGRTVTSYAYACLDWTALVGSSAAKAVLLAIAPWLAAGWSAAECE